MHQDGRHCFWAYVINIKRSCLHFSHTQGMQARATYKYLVLLDMSGWTAFTCKGGFWEYVIISTKLSCLHFSHKQGMQVRATYKYLVLLNTSGWTAFICTGGVCAYVKIPNFRVFASHIHMVCKPEHHISI